MDLKEKKEILENLNYEMLFQDINKKYQDSLDKIKQLENELQGTKIRLKKYTAERKKKFYQVHIEEIIEKVKEYQKTHPPKKQDPELRKERNKRYYEKKKKKKKA